MKKPRYECITGYNNSFFNYENYGNFGTELYVNTKELESTMKQEGFSSIRDTPQLKILFNELNLALRAGRPPRLEIMNPKVKQTVKLQIL